MGASGDWISGALAIFTVLAFSGAFAMLVSGHVYLWRHWKEVFRDVKARRVLLETGREVPKDAARYADSWLRGPLLFRSDPSLD